MALSKGVLKATIITELHAQGFITVGEHAKAALLAEAIANAVVDHIHADAEVQTTSGAPDGEHTGIIL
ncbi:MAG: hypothetical protein PHY09_18415 [Desulfuromonadaceae bacterium]|nr:hypothetical protein [Desulfuromonadaceae bacterium]MDD5107551.1 hypothetical protein [Desulfuromonadaceae bacterium]